MQTMSPDTIYNFCAGPAVLPQDVIADIQSAIERWDDTGLSILSVNHRSAEFVELFETTRLQFRKLLNIPESHHVLLMPAGATAQFSAVPMNLLNHNPKAGYVVTGYWGNLAFEEAKRYGDIQLVAQGIDAALNTHWSVDDDLSYVHCTPNESIAGIEFQTLPKTSVPIVADMTSNILIRPVDVSQYGIIYASAQKNLGVTGLAVVIIREDLVTTPLQHTPKLLRYEENIRQSSMINTPSTLAVYALHRMLSWVESQGGLSTMKENANIKANTLYQAIDNSALYYNDVPDSCRSLTNIPFHFREPQHEALFIEQAQKAGLKNLKGHRSTGGIRASIYNAMTLEGVSALIDFMNHFEQQHA